MKRRSTAVPTRDRILDEVERLIALKGVYGFKLRDISERLELQVSGYWTWRDEYHPNSAGHFLTLFSVFSVLRIVH